MVPVFEVTRLLIPANNAPANRKETYASQFSSPDSKWKRYCCESRLKVGVCLLPLPKRFTFKPIYTTTSRVVVIL